MSSTWIDLVFRARRATSRALAAVGTWPMAAGLLATAALYRLATELTARVASDAAADALATSPAFAALCAAMTIDAAAAALRALGPIVAARRVRGLRDRLDLASKVLLHGAYLFVALGLAATFLARDESRVWVAAGETFEGASGQYLSRMPQRRMSPGPMPVGFTVDAVEADVAPDGVARALSARLAFSDGGRGETTLARPVWLGWGRFLYASGFGYAPRLEVADARGAVLDSAYAKLRLLPRGRRDNVRSVSLPHRLYAAIPATESLGSGDAGLAALALQVEVWRGKVPVTDGTLRPGAELAFEGVVLRMADVRYWVELTMLSDPGIPLLVIAGAAALLGAVARRLARRTGGA